MSLRACVCLASAVFLGGPSTARAGLLTGYAEAGLQSEGVTFIFVAFDAPGVPGVTITRATFDFTGTTAAQVFESYGTGQTFNNGVGSFAQFRLDPFTPPIPPYDPGSSVSQVFGFTATGFDPGDSLEIGMHIEDISAPAFRDVIPSDLLGGVVTVEFSNGLTATGTLDTVSRGGIAVRADFSVSDDPSPVPEPASLALLAVGGLGLLGYTRRRGQGTANVTAAQ
ncbi:MAG: PEP-CTERM sorting domain-containing protein [Gemmataceae bacterium]|nr:PEP-CTERM sorting domain-containing protein [Gemmataceae bacterium]